MSGLTFGMRGVGGLLQLPLVAQILQVVAYEKVAVLNDAQKDRQAFRGAVKLQGKLLIRDRDSHRPAIAKQTNLRGRGAVSRRLSYIAICRGDATGMLLLRSRRRVRQADRNSYKVFT